MGRYLGVTGHRLRQVNAAFNTASFELASGGDVNAFNAWSLPYSEPMDDPPHSRVFVVCGKAVEVSTIGSRYRITCCSE